MALVVVVVVMEGAERCEEGGWFRDGSMLCREGGAGGHVK